MRNYLICFTLFLLFISSAALAAFDFEVYKKAVVSISAKNKYFFEWNKAGSFSGTGFIVDLKNRYIVTNKHIVNEYPTQIRIKFFDKTTTNAKLIYTDIYHDFSILQYDKNTLTGVLKKLELGDFFSVKVKDKLYLIGNNEAEGITFKQGIAVNLRKNKGTRYSLTLQTNFDRTGGSSGSPVFDRKGKVVGLHFKGTDTSSFELAINYVKDVLDNLSKGKKVNRRDLGIRLNYISIDDACQYLNFDKKFIKHLDKKNSSAQVVMVKQMIPQSLAQGKLKVGDIVLKVNGKDVGDNLYLIDNEANKFDAVTFSIFRQGKTVEVKVKSKDYSSERIGKFITFGGAVFHGLNNNIRVLWDIDGQGVYISQAFPGSSFDSIGYSNSKNVSRKGVVVKYINGVAIKDLDHLESILNELKDGSKISIVFKDYFYSSPAQMKFITLDLSTSSQRTYSFDHSLHKWVSDKLHKEGPKKKSALVSSGDKATI